ncbi:MAG: hypothetical protein M0R46_09665 [Candidatus Muirbacterium halophilum]|nr:hypothetical protein [Candidatus Muirbacterium halophilum]MCK9476176.1 hypothetical protein [Candidatus Muirbacterium halophilum]
MDNKKKTDIFKRIYKSECTVQDDMSSFRGYNIVHAYDIDMLATAKNRKIIAYFIKENDEEMEKAFDDVGKLQMKLNVLSDVLKKNNETQEQLYGQIKDFKEELKLEKDINEKYRLKIIDLLKKLKRKDECFEYYTEDEKNSLKKSSEEVLEDDDINDIINKK